RERTQAMQRHDAIDSLRSGLWQALRGDLKGCSDVERITARIALRQVRPRELVGLRWSIEKSGALSHRLQVSEGLLADIRAGLNPPDECAQRLQRTLHDEPAAMV